MDDDFDIDSAVTEVSEGLGLEVTATEVEGDNTANTADTGGDVELSVEADKTTTPPTAEVVDPAKSTPTTPPPSPTDIRAPASWRPEAKAEFDKLSPVVKAEVAKREEDILRGIGEYKAAATFGQAVDRAISPYTPLLRQHGIDPVRHVSELMEVHKSLAFGTPQQKQETLATLAKNFGVELSPSQSLEDSPYVDPEVASLREQVTKLQSFQQQLVNQQTAAQQQQIQQIRQTLSTELNTFAADPEHAFFDEVAPDMAMLIQSGRATSLKQAYDLALRMSPEALQRENLRLAAKTATQNHSQPKAAAAKTTAARNATGVNVRANGAGSTVKSVAPGPGLQSLDKSIEAEFDRIMAGS